MVDETRVAIEIEVNGETYRETVPAYRTLLAFLRDDLNLTGSKQCCGEGECGACTVIADGDAVNSCLVLAAEMNGAKIVTVEGLALSPLGSSIQKAFLDSGSVQCGFCTPGMLMSAYYLLLNNQDPTVAEIREGLSGNLCRCTGYNKIVDAVASAVHEGKA